MKSKDIEKKPIDYIKKINVNSANFRHIADTGNINGTLLTELIKLISEVRKDALSTNQPEKEEEKVRLFKYEDANCHANIVTLKHGSYNCTECGAFMGTSWGSDTKVDRSKLTEINVNDLV